MHERSKEIIDEKDSIIARQREAILMLQRRLRQYESFNEWENIEYFNDWSDRSMLMSRLIDKSCTSLLDLGCGEMHIKKYISPDITYYGCDYKKRDDKTIICDLAVGEFPQISVDTIFIAGVLEYLVNWQQVLTSSAKACRQIVMSYSTSESSPVRNPIWVNNIPESELINFMMGGGHVSDRKDPAPIQ